MRPRRSRIIQDRALQVAGLAGNEGFKAVGDGFQQVLGVSITATLALQDECPFSEIGSHSLGACLRRVKAQLVRLGEWN